MLSYFLWTFCSRYKKRYNHQKNIVIITSFTLLLSSLSYLKKINTIFYTKHCNNNRTNLQQRRTKLFKLSSRTTISNYQNKIINDKENFQNMQHQQHKKCTKNIHSIYGKCEIIKKIIQLFNKNNFQRKKLLKIEFFNLKQNILLILINLLIIIITNRMKPMDVNGMFGNETLLTTTPTKTLFLRSNNESDIEIENNNNIKLINLFGIINSDELDENIVNNNSFTPSMSQTLLAPTILTSTIHSTSSTLSSASTIVNAVVAAPAVSNSIAININGTDDGINSFYFYETEQFAFLWVLFTVIVLGNSAVLVTLFMNKNRKSRMNFFIKQLALADLCVGLLNVLTDIIWRITVSWRAGNLACKVIRFSQVCVTYASTYVLVALSIDRYDAITHPMNFSGSWQRARRLVVSAWAISAIFSAPMLILYEEKLIQGQKQCWIELGESWRWQLYMTLVSVTLFAFPALIISACYAIIVRTIWVKGSVFIPAERTAGRNSACLASRRASSRGIIPRAKVKTVKMTFVIVIVFVVCWSPYIIFDLLQVFGQIPRTQTNIAIATFIQSLAPLNSAANPLIYCLFSTQVCRALKRIPPFRWMLCNCCCQTQGHNSAPIRCTTVGQRLHNSCDSMRTLTTSLNVSRRSNNCMRPARVVIVERPKTILAMSEV